MFKQIASLAVLLLISDTEAIRHRARQQKMNNRAYVQFPDEYDDDEAIQTSDSIQQAEKLHGKTLGVTDATYKQALVQNNKLSFGGDGQTFEKVFKIKNSMENPHGPVPGVTMAQNMAQQKSDPIWGSLGVPGIPKQDLTPEQQFEQSQRNMKPAELKDSDEVIATNNSIKIAEGIVKEKMPNPSDPKEKLRMANSAQAAPEYHLHTADEEDEDTVETRRSVKTVEKRMKHRFFINAKERKQYDADVAAGKISAKEIEFAEGDDEEIGGKVADEPAKAKKEADAKKGAADKAAEDGAKKEGEGDAKAEGEKKEEEKKEGEEAKKAGEAKAEEKKEDAAKEDKKESAAQKAGGDKGGDKKAADFVPPELAGMAQKSNRVAF